MSRIVQIAITTVYISASSYFNAVALRVAVILYLSDESEVYHIDEYKNVIRLVIWISSIH